MLGDVLKSLKVDLRAYPTRSWRAKGVYGIFARKASSVDPAFDIDGLPSPFSVYFPIVVTNLYSAALYVTAIMISPPAGWSDAEDNVVSIPVGEQRRVEKDNATRTTPTAGTNETITVRWNYRITSYAGTIIGYDEFTFTIYWESIAAGTIDDTDDFETDFEGWVKTDIVGSPTMRRTSTYFVHGTWALELYHVGPQECYIEKSVSMGAGTRAYLFGFQQVQEGTIFRCSIVSPVETLEIVYNPTNTWRRWGVRLNPAVANTVRIYSRSIWGASGLSYYSRWDYLRWVRY